MNINVSELFTHSFLMASLHKGICWSISVVFISERYILMDVMESVRAHVVLIDSDTSAITLLIKCLP